MHSVCNLNAKHSNRFVQMKIEIACKESDNTKIKGDLFEGLSRDLLLAQNYEVIEEIRITGAELDLLCKHKISGKQVYVECKAQKDKIGAPILRQLLGTITAYDYAEGWLVSTSEFGKEAKGFVENWKSKPSEQASKLSFYSPDLIIESLKAASVICEQPIEKATEIAGSAEKLGSWSLIVSEYGRYWAVYTLKAGAPYGVLLFHATSGKLVSDRETVTNIAKLEAEISDYDIYIGTKPTENTVAANNELPNVAEVQIGDSWNDYRPARPQDFVGRDSTQKEILNFLGSVRECSTDSRIFAITGNSGLGKSSLIAKLRDRSKNKHYKKKYFIYAVDIRGATTPSYIAAALLKGLNEAQAQGFGDKIKLTLTDPASPMTSKSITKFLRSLREKEQVVCLVFDQFEELYSKPDLFGIFKAAKNLMLDIAAIKENIALGFAWKTDSTTQQDHPAYHMWHDLADYRKVYKLNVFDPGEISASITKFEKEIQRQIPVEIRHQLTHNSQGFPWLLKKLCINLYENIIKGDDDSILPDFDVRALFEEDVASLSPEEFSCLKVIANSAPADWSEIIEISGINTVNSLVNKRLIIKSGTRLNIYWDIFKDYLTTGRVPVVPFNYVPTSDFNSMYKVALKLTAVSYQDAKSISAKTGHNERTIWNIGADLVMLGIADRKGVNFKLREELSENHENAIVLKLRQKFDKHSVKLALFKKFSGKTVENADIKSALKNCMPNSNFNDKTWQVYTNRFIKIFIATGYLVKIGRKLTVQDTGTPLFDKDLLNRKRTTRERGIVFSATSSPASVCDALDLIRNGISLKNLNEKGYRNALQILTRFDLIRINPDSIIVSEQAINKFGGVNAAIWSLAKSEPTVSKCIKKIESCDTITGFELGLYVAQEYNMTWTESSQKRNGNSLRQWSTWVKDGIDNSFVPAPPGRKK